jgi:osmotically-inducible protein OsmY
MQYSLHLALSVSLLTLAPAAWAQQQQARTETRGQSNRYEAGNQELWAKRLASRVESRLASSLSLYGSDIDVSAEDGTVTLTGKVADQQARQRAGHLARRTAGVDRVDNQLQVDKAFVDKRTGVNVPDEQLAKQVAQKIAAELNADAEEDWLYGWEVEAGAWEIEVDADAGVVTLGGDAASYDAMRTAVLTARDSPGVHAVRNDMDLSVDTRYDRGWGYGPGYGYPGRYPYWP